MAKAMSGHLKTLKIIKFLACKENFAGIKFGSLFLGQALRASLRKQRNFGAKAFPPTEFIPSKEQRVFGKKSDFPPFQVLQSDPTLIQGQYKMLGRLLLSTGILLDSRSILVIGLPESQY